MFPRLQSDHHKDARFAVEPRAGSGPVVLIVINKYRSGQGGERSHLVRIKIDFVFMKCRGYFGTTHSLRFVAYGGFPPSENRRDLIVSHSRCIQEHDN